MNKPINLTEGMKLYRAWENASEEVSRCRERVKFYADRAVNHGRNPEDDRDFCYYTELRDKALVVLGERAHAMMEYVNSKLEPVVDEAQKRCTERLIVGLDILKLLAEVEDTLGISKKAMDGISVEVDKNAQNLPGAYKWQAKSTQFVARYKNNHWTLADVDRYSLMPEKKRIVILHTKASIDAIINKYTNIA